MCGINNKNNNTYWFSGPSKGPAGTQKIKWAVTQYRACNILSMPVYTHTNIPIYWDSNQSLSREQT